MRAHDDRGSSTRHDGAAAACLDPAHRASARARELRRRGTPHQQHASSVARRAATVRAACGVAVAGLEHQRALAAGHRQIDVEQHLRVEQRAVQLALRVVDAIALAQRIEAVALAGVQLSRERQRVEHRAEADTCRRRRPAGAELRVEERDVEGRVVDDQLRAADELA